MIISPEVAGLMRKCRYLSPSTTSVPRVTRQQEDELINIWHNHPSPGVRKEAMDTVTVLRLPLAWKTARLFCGRRNELLDVQREYLREEAVVALVKAAHDFRPDKGSGFSHYALTCIRRGISRAMCRVGIVSIPKSIWSSTHGTVSGVWLLAVVGEYKRSEEREGRTVSVEDLALWAGVTLDVMQSMIAMFLGGASSTGRMKTLEDAEVLPSKSPEILAAREARRDLSLAFAQFRATQKPKYQRLLDAILSGKFNTGAAAKSENITRQMMWYRVKALHRSIRSFFTEHYPELIPFGALPEEAPHHV